MTLRGKGAFKKGSLEALRAGFQILIVSTICSATIIFISELRAEHLGHKLHPARKRSMEKGCFKTLRVSR